VAALVVEWVTTGDLEVLVRAAVGLVIARTAFWVLWFFGAGLGFGDARLAALVGLVTARLGWQSFVVGIYGALVLAVLYVLARAVVTRRSPRGQGIPFGPFLVVGAWVGLRWGRLVIASSSDPTVVDRLRRDVDALCVTSRHCEVPGSLEAARAYCRKRLEEVGWSVEERSFGRGRRCRTPMLATRRRRWRCAGSRARGWTPVRR
jgi:hypothetical protein